MSTPNRIEETSEYCEVQLTEKELLDIGKKGAAARSEQARLEAAFDTIKTEFKGKIQAEENKQTNASQLINSGKETRPVKCERTWHWPDGKVRTVRLDTGEIVKERDIMPNERQQDLPIETGVDTVTFRLGDLEVTLPLEHAGMADKMLEIRDTYKGILGEAYPAKMKQVAAALKREMKVLETDNELEAAIALIKKDENRATATMVYVSGALEMQESGTKKAKK